jgi:hypothetical protein
VSHYPISLASLRSALKPSPKIQGRGRSDRYVIEKKKKKKKKKKKIKRKEEPRAKAPRRRSEPKARPKLRDMPKATINQLIKSRKGGHSNSIL